MLGTKQPASEVSCRVGYLFRKYCTLDTIQDFFLCMLGMKQLQEIIVSLKHVIIRPTKLLRTFVKPLQRKCLCTALQRSLITLVGDKCQKNDDFFQLHNWFHTKNLEWYLLRISPTLENNHSTFQRVSTKINKLNMNKKELVQ